MKRRDHDQSIFLLVELENELLSQKEELFRLTEAVLEFKAWALAGPTAYPPLTKKERFEALDRDGFRCRYCGANPRSDGAIELHVDHLIPRAQGGDNSLENRVTACQACNLGKGSSPLKYLPEDLIEL